MHGESWISINLAGCVRVEVACRTKGFSAQEALLAELSLAAPAA